MFCLAELKELPGKFSSGIDCDGVDDYVRTNSLDNSKFEEYTVQGWVRINDLNSDDVDDVFQHLSVLLMMVEHG